MLKKTTSLKRFLIYFLLFLFIFILVISIIDSIKLRFKIKDIEEQVNKRVEEEIKWYEENIRNYEKEIEKYRKLYYESKRKANYYRNIYEKLQFSKTKIELPKTSKELRERFRKLGYEPIN